MSLRTAARSGRVTVGCFQIAIRCFQIAIRCFQIAIGRVQDAVGRVRNGSRILRKAVYAGGDPLESLSIVLDGGREAIRRLRDAIRIVKDAIRSGWIAIRAVGKPHKQPRHRSFDCVLGAASRSSR
jgi:hypothetical protein